MGRGCDKGQRPLQRITTVSQPVRRDGDDGRRWRRLDPGGSLGQPAAGSRRVRDRGRGTARSAAAGRRGAGGRVGRPQGADRGGRAGHPRRPGGAGRRPARHPVARHRGRPRRSRPCRATCRRCAGSSATTWWRRATLATSCPARRRGRHRPLRPPDRPGERDRPGPPDHRRRDLGLRPGAGPLAGTTAAGPGRVGGRSGRDRAARRAAASPTIEELVEIRLARR